MVVSTCTPRIVLQGSLETSGVPSYFRLVILKHLSRENVRLRDHFFPSVFLPSPSSCRIYFTFQRVSKMYMANIKVIRIKKYLSLDLFVEFRTFGIIIVIREKKIRSFMPRNRWQISQSFVCPFVEFQFSVVRSEIITLEIKFLWFKFLCLSNWVMTSIKGLDRYAKCRNDINSFLLQCRFTEIMEHEDAGKKFSCRIN